jgi:3,4-dihydroxy 2-butanone 4-phosphate synthase/GTP cyclohydrolase II
MISKALKELANEGIVLLIDDSEPVNAPRVIVFTKAANTTPEKVNKLTKLTGGVLLVAIKRERAEKMLLSPMSRSLLHEQTSDWNILTSVEAREGVSTGISAFDRARTAALIAEANPSPRSIVQPGHIFPVLVHEGGVLAKHALPEGACDLVNLASGSEAALFAEMLDKNGDRFSPSELAKLNIPSVTLSALTRYRLETEPLITCVAEAKIPTRLAGEVRSYIFKSKIHDGEHLALVKGEISAEIPVLTRVQSEFTFADVFGGSTPPSRNQLLASLSAIGARGSGILVYLRRSETGLLKTQISSWEEYFSKKPANMFEYGIGAQILRHLGARKINLLTTSSKSLIGLDSFGLEITEQTRLL